MLKPLPEDVVHWTALINEASPDALYFDPIASETWKPYANCLGAGDKIFTDRTDNYAAAKEICSRCVVVEPCLATALKYETHGIGRERDLAAKNEPIVWGGKTLRERRAMLRDQSRSVNS